MSYEAMDFSGLVGMDGFSKELLEDHFQLYEGYVTETNALLDQLKGVSPSERSSAEHAELRRRLGWEFNGMRLHELYFGNLGGDGRPPTSGELGKLLAKGRGGFDAWLSEFKSVGKIRGVGWAIFYVDPIGGRAETSLDRGARHRTPRRCGAATGHGRLGARVHDGLSHQP